MAVYLHGIETVTPSTVYQQDSARDVMVSWIGGDRRTDLLLNRVYGRSGIETRHSVVTDFEPDGPRGLFLDAEGRFRQPSTAERNDRYVRDAACLFPQAAAGVLASSQAFTAEQVTHLVTVSCTGFYAPGPDLGIVRALRLRPTTERYHLGFMGCYAAFPALRMARAFCEADANAVVLVVVLELCSLHLSPTTKVDDIVAGSVFADGGAAVLVSAKPPRGRSLRLDRFLGTVTEDGADVMAWTIGDTGFRMALSSYVPRIVGARAGEVIDPLLESAGLDRSSVRRWAVHPGGRAILDKVQAGLELEDAGLSASRSVLRRFGNMSSATVLFVLETILEEQPTAGEPIVAMAFGPGLTVDAGLFTVA